MKTKNISTVNLYVLVLIFLIFISSINNIKSQSYDDSIFIKYTSYKHEIKDLFEDHYGKEFKNSPEMKDACINYIERKIDGELGTTYKTCNYFVTRRFSKSAYESNDLISLEDILFADYKLEFVEDILINPQFESSIADKINVEIGGYGDYIYVVVGISSTWYEKNTDLLTF